MSHPKLLVNAEPKVLADQIESWGNIVRLSEKITTIVDLGKWTEVLSLAETRDEEIVHFFAKGVCKELLPHISESLEEIKSQHKEIMIQLEERQSQNKEDEKYLIEAKYKLEQSPALAQDPENTESK